MRFDMKLYTYWRSSAAYRIRIALNLKGLRYFQVPIHLARDEHKQDAFRAVNPQGRVPALEHDGNVITQSMAICEYLEETFSEPALLPADPVDRARVRALCQLIACEIHPMNNLSVLRYVSGELGVDDAAKQNWYAHWVAVGFSAYEAFVADSPHAYSFGDSPTLADAFLVPQVYNARRFDCDLAPYPNIVRIEQACLELDPFADAVPESQPDATETA